MPAIASQTGHVISDTDLTVVLDRVVDHDTLLASALLVLWGASGRVAKLVTGRLADAIGNRRVILAGLAILVAAMVWLPNAGADLGTSRLPVPVEPD
ncbi:MFS transporter [Methylobacterium planeticum]|uniref:MFS transporter n=1 Tax=Methylobacterium planeticum TaxID=2615211 RepID=A0A6N6MME2_9HYPH|nr:MFS transporter [Methylobacterium planeticum]KAB1072492.1 MFS transporter [Methylobacterium planeticum]